MATDETATTATAEPETIPARRGPRSLDGAGALAPPGPSSLEGVEIPLRPETRAKRGAAGIPVALGDGQTWLLAHGGLAPPLTTLRDDIYDGMVLKRTVDIAAALHVAWVLLRANYALTPEETARLLCAADEQALCEAVLDALYGQVKKVRRTWTEWVQVSLLMNGIDPATVPPALLPALMQALEQTGRTVPEAEFISASEAAAERAGWINLARELEREKRREGPRPDPAAAGGTEGDGEAAG